MTESLIAALRHITADLGADASALLRVDGPGGARITVAIGMPDVEAGAVWPASPRLADAGFSALLVSTPGEVAEFVPTAVRLATPEPVTAVLVVPVAGSRSRMLLLWFGDHRPSATVLQLDSSALHRLTELAPLMESQSRAREAASRLHVVIESLDQAVVILDEEGGRAELNPAAGRLLGLEPGEAEPEVVAAALRGLRERSVDPAGLRAAGEQLLADRSAVIRDWLWSFDGSPSHLRVNSTPLDGPGVRGRVWVFDDISTQMGLLEAERAARSAAVESEQRFRLMAENVSDVVAVGDNEGVMQWVSPSVTALLGWMPEDLMGHAFRDILHPDDLPGVVAGQAMLGAGRTQTFEVRVRAANGTYHWVNARTKPVFDAAGNVVGRVAGWWDAEAAHAAREALAASEARYRMLVENASDIVFHTVEGVVEWISPSIESILGWTPEQMIGSTTAHLWHEDDRAAVIALRERVYNGLAGRGVFRFRTGSGEYVWVEVALRPSDGPQGKRGAVGQMHDVTDRVAAEMAARESEARYRLLAENASDVVFQGDNRAVVQWLSPSVQEVLGRAPEEIVGHSVTELIHPDDIPKVLEASAKATAGGRVSYRARYTRANGDIRWCEVTARPVYDEQGAVVSRVGSLRDVHDEVLAEMALAESEVEARRLAAQYELASREAEDANRAKTAFLSRMSHELRTPLNAVLGFAQLLAMDPLTEEQREAVQHIRTGGKHLLELINEVLDISRIEAGRLSLSMESVHVGEAVNEALDLVRPIAASAGVVLSPFDKDACSETVWADRQRVIQVTLNLLTNAVKYNRDGGSVSVTCEPMPDNLVAIRVRDTGIGISEELRSRLFQPFDRLGAEATKIEGTGIGLTLSEALARAMSGHIDVQSTVGVGSVFSLVLQSASSPSESSGPALLPSIAMPGRAIRILYIEDNPANLQLMARIVEHRESAQLITASDGHAGLALAFEEAPDLVFLDVHLPDLRGDEILKQLRADPRTRHLPIVVVTADASSELRQRMTDLGATGFLTKPVEIREVLRWIDESHGGEAR